MLGEQVGCKSGIGHASFDAQMARWRKTKAKRVTWYHLIEGMVSHSGPAIILLYQSWGYDACITVYVMTPEGLLLEPASPHPR